MPNDTIEVFISYSKQDKELRDGLLSHLRPLEREGIITWHDRQILPGTEWDNEIRARLNAADIILLLISADFLATDYCTQVEIPEALRRHEADEAIVMPVILRSCGWKYTPLAAIQAYPEKAKPIRSWSDIDEAYTNVVDGVYLAATEIKNRRNQQHQAQEQQRQQLLVQQEAEQRAEREVYSELARMLAETEKLTESIATCYQAVQDNPHDANAYYRLGMALNQQGYVAEAIAAYHQALSINPALAEVHNQLGLALSQQGNLSEAIRSYDHAIQLDPGLTTARRNLEIALLRQGNVGGANPVLW